MKKIRVLLANHPSMVPEVIRQLVVEQDDMEVVSDCRGPMRILQEVGRTQADAVIFAHEGSDEPGLCSQLLAVYPDLTILGLSPDRKTAFTEQLCSHRRNIVYTQNDSLVAALRGATREPCREEDR